MSDDIVHFASPVTLLGAGNVARQSLFRALRIAPHLVAADGGANMAIAAGHVPEAVIGDLDSIRDDVRAAIPAERLHVVSEQETTDFEKCLMRIEAPFILGLGFAGPRADHTLAVWNALARHGHRRCVILGAEDIAFIAPRRIFLDLSSGTRVSLFPMAEMSGTSTGLEWPIAGLDFAPDRRIGTSNSARGPVEMEFDRARMLVLLPKTALRSAIAGLLASRW